YNQIFMHPEDQAHTSFITDRGLYCYKVMPFGLKNAGATYQRLVNHLFAPLIGNTMEVYVDDMLVKSRTADQHIPNLSAMFTILKQYKMRLNPTKCAFGVASGKFLGFMISQRGIEANPEKIQAILDMTIPKTVKDIKSLTGRVAALTRFISKATDRCAPFFKALKGTKRNITWTAECETAFSELKEYMGRAPLLSTPEHGDILVVYLSVSASAVSSVLIRSKDNAEHPVHYVSKALQDAEVRYPDIEKLAFSLVISARRLRPYFQAHTIHVLTNQLLRQVLQKPETSGRLVKWAIELGEFDIHYKPRPTMKGQAVADFLSEFTEPQASAATQLITEPNPSPSQDQT
ncbi:PREDICTED: Retrovirus-related Pol poly from transposon, partial [Prunus dulcis]